MNNSENCPSPPIGHQARPYWRAGSRLTAEACTLEQNFRLQKLRRHNRDLHGWGVLCGLWVVPAKDARNPWEIQICPGYAVGPHGDEIEVIQPARINVEDYLWFRPKILTAIAVIPTPAYVAIRYQNWTDDLTMVPNAPCTCGNPSYVDARIADGVKAGIVWTPASDFSRPKTLESLCDPDSLPCPPCPPSPWVVLASIHLPPRGTPITAALIDNSFRNSL
jgi:hypothetical protein